MCVRVLLLWLFQVIASSQVSSAPKKRRTATSDKNEFNRCINQENMEEDNKHINEACRARLHELPPEDESSSTCPTKNSTSSSKKSASSSSFFFSSKKSSYLLLLFTSLLLLTEIVHAEPIEILYVKYQ